MKELPRSRMRNPLKVEPLFECREQLIEISRLNHRPWYDVQVPAMKTRDKIGVSLLLDDLLELERKPMNGDLARKSHMGHANVLLASDFDFIGFDNILRARSNRCQRPSPKTHLDNYDKR